MLIYANFPLFFLLLKILIEYFEYLVYQRFKIRPNKAYPQDQIIHLCFMEITKIFALGYKDNSKLKIKFFKSFLALREYLLPKFRENIKFFTIPFSKYILDLYISFKEEIIDKSTVILCILSEMNSKNLQEKSELLISIIEDFQILQVFY